MMKARTIGLAHSRQFRQRLPKPLPGHFEYLAFLRLAASSCQRRGTHEHRDVSGEISRAAGREDFLLPVARLEYLDLATQYHRKRHVALTRL